VAVVTANKS